MRDPRHVLGLGPADWNALLDCAGRHALLGRLAVVVEDAGLLAELPQVAQDLLADSAAMTRANQTMQRYEANRVQHALRGMDIPVVLLKGGAYLMAGLPPSRGRLSGDLDILVPRERIEQVEQALLAQGWQSPVMDAYDQRYYREWSHQIPPLRHVERKSELDVHHTIAPPTGRAGPDTQAILRDARPLTDGGLRVLCPPDMVLHSAVHLFNEQMTMALRDLIDMHDLLSHFGGDEAFWPELANHAAKHNLQGPLYYCTRYCRRFLGTSIPAGTLGQIEAFAPNPLARRVMDWLVAATLVHEHPDRQSPGARFARWLLFVRSHWLRMPPAMLIRHILVKTFRRARPDPSPNPCRNLDAGNRRNGQSRQGKSDQIRHQVRDRAAAANHKQLQTFRG